MHYIYIYALTAKIILPVANNLFSFHVFIQLRERKNYPINDFYSPVLQLLHFSPTLFHGTSHSVESFKFP